MKTTQAVGTFLLALVVGACAHADASVEENDEVKAALAMAKVSLSQAIEIARQEVKTAHLIEAELEMEGKTAAYDIEFLTGSTVKEVEIDAVSGKVLEVETEELDEEHKDHTAAFEKALAKAKITLARAVEIAQKRVPGGKPYEAEFELEDGILRCEVELLAGEKFMEVEIDAETGKVLEVEEKEEEEDDGDRRATTWNFDAGPTGAVPKGWSIRQTNPTTAMATWQVVTDATAPSKGNVLGLIKTENYNGTYNLAIADRTSFKDLDLTVKVKAVRGNEDQGGGPIWRCKDENNYYICRFNPLEGNYRVYFVKDGRRKQLKTIKVETEAGKWYAVRVTMLGDRIACYLDGKKLLDVHDDTFKDAGMVGFWTKADAATRFDDLVVLPFVKR